MTVDLGEWSFATYCDDEDEFDSGCSGVFIARPNHSDSKPYLELEGYEPADRVGPIIDQYPDDPLYSSGPDGNWYICFTWNRGSATSKIDGISGLALTYLVQDTTDFSDLEFRCDNTWKEENDDESDYRWLASGTYTMREIGDALPLDFVLITDSTGGSNPVVKGYVPGPTNIVPSSLALEGVPAKRTRTCDENRDNVADICADWQGHGLPTPQEGVNTWTVTGMDTAGQSCETQITVTCRGPTCD